MSRPEVTQVARDRMAAAQQARWAAHRKAILEGHAVPCTPVIPSMRRIEAVIAALAAAKAAMPNNARLAELAGCRRSTILRGLLRLQDLGRLVIQTSRKSRICTVVATGQSTGWGRVRPGHPPFINRPPPSRSTRPQSVLKGYGHAPSLARTAALVATALEAGTQGARTAAAVARARRHPMSAEALLDAAARGRKQWAGLSPEQQAAQLARLRSGKRAGGPSKKSPGTLAGARLAARRRRNRL